MAEFQVPPSESDLLVQRRRHRRAVHAEIARIAREVHSEARAAGGGGAGRGAALSFRGRPPERPAALIRASLARTWRCVVDYQRGEARNHARRSAAATQAAGETALAAALRACTDRAATAAHWRHASSIATDALAARLCERIADDWPAPAPGADMPSESHPDDGPLEAMLAQLGGDARVGKLGM